MSYRVIKEGLEGGEKGGMEGEKEKERDVIQRTSVGRVE